MPEIASDGIQVIDVTDFSIRIGEPLPLYLRMLLQAKLNRQALRV
jgi:hypothetical protein